MENPEKIEIAGLKTIHKLCNFGADRNMEGCTFTEIVERMFDELAKAQAVQEGFVLVPRECPDPIFADKLFDHLCKKAHGEFGDDQMIFFSDIDESAIWQLMIEAQEQSHD